MEGSESCDDGNPFSGDGCSSTCQVETGYTCSGSPSICLKNPISLCGNGAINYNLGEACDDGNLRNGDGCSSSCTVETGYKCSGQPSVCSLVPTTSLSLVGNVSINMNNVYLVLQTNPTFTFANQSAMESFMQTGFPSGNSLLPAVYCAQENSPNLQNFDCLLIYPSGVPNQPFNLTFSYNYQGKAASTTVLVNPLNVKLSARQGI